MYLLRRGCRSPGGSRVHQAQDTEIDGKTGREATPWSAALSTAAPTLSCPIASAQDDAVSNHAGQRAGVEVFGQRPVIEASVTQSLQVPLLAGRMTERKTRVFVWVKPTVSSQASIMHAQTCTQLKLLGTGEMHSVVFSAGNVSPCRR